MLGEESASGAILDIRWTEFLNIRLQGYVTKAARRGPRERRVGQILDAVAGATSPRLPMAFLTHTLFQETLHVLSKP